MNIWNNKESLLAMLDQADFDTRLPNKTNRRDAYVTELYYEKNIIPLIAESVTKGWCYTKFNWNNKIQIHTHRNWFKIIPSFDSWKEKDLDRKFIKTLSEKDKRQRFFLVSLKAPTDLNNYFEIREYISSGLLRHEKKIADIVNIISKNNMNEEVSRLMALPKLVESFSNKWLTNESSSTLALLLAQRILMNTGLKYPIDVDAIDINNHKILFHEFKRKDPCNSRVRATSGVANVAFLRELEKELKQATNNTDSMTSHQFEIEIDEYLKNKSFKKAPDKSYYGLDHSHVGNVQYCEFYDIEYIYTIWDSSNFGKYPIIDHLFSSPNVTKKEVSLLSTRLDSTMLNNFTYTYGKDSGHFSEGIRTQAALNKDDFLPIKRSTNHL